MNNKIRLFFFGCLGLLFGITVMYTYNQFIADKEKKPQNNLETKKGNTAENSSEIYSITEEKKIISFVKQNHHLPDYYITKNEAKKQGWNPSKGNLCEILPGKAIGGDHFSNREKKLPTNKKYFEADVNYNCGNRTADRIVFTEDGEVYLTKNHYKSFEKQ